MKNTLLQLILKSILFLFIFMCIGCGETEKQEIKFKPNSEGLFEGEIVLNQKRNYDEAEVKFIISDSIIVREAVLIESFLPTGKTAGTILDLKQKTVTLYQTDGTDWLQKLIKDKADGLKATMTFAEYEKLLETYKFESYEIVTPQDYMFSHLESYDETIGRDNVLPALKLRLDYHLYHEGLLVQDVFDSPKVNVAAELLPLLFPEIPDDLNFPLIYRLYRLRGQETDFDAATMSEDEIAELIVDGLSNSFEAESNLIKLIERAITKEDVFRDLSGFHETDAMYILQKQRYSGGGGGFGFGDD